MVRREVAATFQTVVPNILGKVRDVGDEHADRGGKEEKRRQHAANTKDVSADNYARNR